MKHISLTSQWQFSTDGFPAYRCSMQYGRNQTDEACLPVKGVTPQENGFLPENSFRLLKEAEKGTIMVVGGEDTTNRCLLFVSSSGGFRGGVDILKEATTGKLLAECSASNACNSGIAVAALLDIGQSMAFHSYGRRTNQVEVHTWNGVEVESQTWEKQDWDRRNDPTHSEENITWLPGNFRLFQLSGNDTSSGITLDADGNCSQNGCGQMAHGFATESNTTLETARFGRDMHNELVIAPIKEGEEVNRERCVVLVHEYSPGCGAKRWPSFYIDWDNAGQVEKLGSTCRGGGSGSDSYKLVIVPNSWAENIAQQFVNERDYGGQTIAYRPEMAPPPKVNESEDKEGNRSYELSSDSNSNNEMAEALQKAGISW
ncbi:MAG: hypothetical protein WC435_00360 [Candidatus Paceibacterota bacterium]